MTAHLTTWPYIIRLHVTLARREGNLQTLFRTMILFCASNCRHCGHAVLVHQPRIRAESTLSPAYCIRAEQFFDIFFYLLLLSVARTMRFIKKLYRIRFIVVWDYTHTTYIHGSVNAQSLYDLHEMNYNVSWWNRINWFFCDENGIAKCRRTSIVN